MMTFLFVNKSILAILLSFGSQSTSRRLHRFSGSWGFCESSSCQGTSLASRRWGPRSGIATGERHNCTVPKIRLCIPRKWKCAASFPIPTFMYLWAVNTFPGSVCLFDCRKIGRPILGIYKSLKRYMNVEIGRQNIIILFWKYRGRTVSFLGIHKSEKDI